MNNFSCILHILRKIKITCIFFLEDCQLCCDHPVIIQKAAIWRISGEAGLSRFTRLMCSKCSIFTCCSNVTIFILSLCLKLFSMDFPVWFAIIHCLTWILMKISDFQDMDVFFWSLAKLKVKWSISRYGFLYSVVWSVCEAYLRRCVEMWNGRFFLAGSVTNRRGVTLSEERNWLAGFYSQQKRTTAKRREFDLKEFLLPYDRARLCF